MAGWAAEKEVPLKPGHEVTITSLEWWDARNRDDRHAVWGAPGVGIRKQTASSRAGIEVEKVRSSSVGGSRSGTGLPGPLGAAAATGGGSPSRWSSGVLS